MGYFFFCEKDVASSVHQEITSAILLLDLRSFGDEWMYHRMQTIVYLFLL